MLGSCFSGTTDSSYRIKSPAVLQFGALAPDDFIAERSGAAGCEAEFISMPATDEPGTHVAAVRVTGRGGYERELECAYTVLPLAVGSVTLEAGSEITAELFANRAVVGTASEHEYRIVSSPVEPLPGTYNVTLEVISGAAFLGESGASSHVLTAELIIVDTTPPRASGVELFLNNDSETPTPYSFVAGIKDATPVTAEFAAEYDFTSPGSFEVEIILRDAAGNSSRVLSSVDCRVDREPPLITGLDDIFVTVGGAVSYKDGVAVSDNSGEEISVTVDAGNVDTNVCGAYEAIYSACDGAGNTTEAVRMIFVVEKLPPSYDEVMAAARAVYDEKIITQSDMSLWDIAYAVYRWTYDNIRFQGNGIDKSSWLQAAYDGFETRRGDCFTYMAVTRALLDCAGIKNTVISRLRYEGESSHYWLLVDIGDGWYHLDSCWHMTAGASFETFMRTDAELEYYGERYSAPHYYRFDHDAYPERATESYYE